LHHLPGPEKKGVRRVRGGGKLLLPAAPLTVKYPNAGLLGAWLKLKLLYRVIKSICAPYYYSKKKHAKIF
jgi:hypothetical protein